MGQEIEQSQFSNADYEQFESRLRSETTYLGELFAQKKLSQRGPVSGFEIEAWLVNHKGLPVAKNQQFLEALADPMVVHELSQFNIELNVEPEALKGKVFSRMQQNLERTWQHCREVARQLETDIVMIGILPSIADDDLTLANMTRSNRYRALNEQVMRLRNGIPLHLDIHGHETLQADHFDVMLESAATSFQIHLQTPLAESVRLFNRAILLSAPMVAVSANSPYLFGHELWNETRIPLFEQAVECGELAHRRVSFGDQYIQQSLFESFLENLHDYPVLVPNWSSEPPEKLSHLRFHNGTIWRWNRPLLGFDEDGTPHLRIEHRVVPAGPSIVDSIANAAFFYGMVYGLEDDSGPEALPFSLARENFYLCARDGLHALVNWPHASSNSIRQILLETLLPAAHKGLKALGIEAAERDYYLGVIETRIRSEQNGAEWQRRWIRKNGINMQALTLRYLNLQNSGLPVAEWKV